MYEFFYCDDSMITLSSSGSRMFSQKVEADSSPDVLDATSVSARFDWDDNFDRSHCMKPGIGLRVANVCRGYTSKLVIAPSKQPSNRVI